MAQRIVNIGTGPNTKDGDNIRNAFDKVNQNFSELYTITGETTDGLIVTDIKGSVFGDDSTAIVDGVTGKITAADVTTASVIYPNVVTRTVSSTVPADTTAVIWASSDENIASAKLVIQAEGSVTPNANGPATWHTQLCEAHVVKRANFTTAPAVSVYGITYTSAAALATFSAQYNMSTNRIEVAATAANAGYPLAVKIFATEFLTSD